MEFSTYIVSVILVIMISLLIASWWYERKSIKDYNNLKVKDVFYCKKCGSVYTSTNNDVDKACDKCGSINKKMSF